ncbi:hypothetical protein BOTBODRAFT_88941, partial [Botryobasidium botryosum FD-172 SS1]
LRWSFRRTTRAAQKVPADAETLGFELAMRLVSLIKDRNIPAPLLLNLDQTNCEYAPGTDLTWNPRGTKQVDAVGQEDKRAFTLTPIVSMAGDLLPFQAVYAGKTELSAPCQIKDKSPQAEETWAYVKAHDLSFTESGNESYWATMKTLQAMFHSIALYFEAQMVQLGLPPHSQCVVIIDAWSVHRSQELRDWIKSMFPWITILYIPAGCTGL